MNDVTNMRDILLKYFGFEVKKVRVLTDRRATKANILKRLEWLIAGAKAGDLLIFHYSGHGSQSLPRTRSGVRDRDGDELKDHLDEILRPCSGELLCPYDLDWDGNFIADDELAALFKRLPAGVRLEVFLDSCHSGTATRYLPGMRAEGEGYLQPRFLPPPVDLLCRLEEEELPIKRLGSSLALAPVNPGGRAGSTISSGRGAGTTRPRRMPSSRGATTGLSPIFCASTSGTPRGNQPAPSY